jgi:hypothetical protein
MNYKAGSDEKEETRKDVSEETANDLKFVDSEPSTSEWVTINN